MARQKKLSSNFYSLDLYYGKAELKPFRNFKCFFIVEHPCDKDFIQQQALMLLLTQCKEFHFYGKQSQLWENEFDFIDSQLHPADDDMDIALTSAWSSLEGFVEALEVSLSERSFVPYDMLLIYDDEGIYSKVLEILKKKNFIYDA